MNMISNFLSVFSRRKFSKRVVNDPRYGRMAQTVCREVFFPRMTRTSRRRQRRSYIPGTRTRNLNTHVKWIHRGPSTLSAVTKPHAKRIPRATEKRREKKKDIERERERDEWNDEKQRRRSDKEREKGT